MTDTESSLTDDKSLFPLSKLRSCHHDNKSNQAVGTDQTAIIDDIYLMSNDTKY